MDRTMIREDGTLTLKGIAHDVAEKAAFESGKVGVYTEQDVSSIASFMRTCPAGVVLIGCGDRPYIKGLGVLKTAWVEHNAVLMGLSENNCLVAYDKRHKELS